MPPTRGKTHHPATTNGHPGREHVTEIQRARMLAAMAQVASERGAANATVAHVVERAGVSRRTFYELFCDREDCFLAAFEEAAARASNSVLRAYDPHAKWPERIRAGLIAFLSFLEREPFMGRLLIAESLAAGPQVLRRRQEILSQVSAALESGRELPKAQPIPSPLTAESVVGGVLSVLHARMTQDKQPGMLHLTGPLMSMIVLPYLGLSAAKRELERAPPPTTAPPSRRPGANPLSDVQMRLTYRTMRVLTALASNPGSSNRSVANAAGVTDQGQMSKLLARLQQSGLIENANTGSPARGEPNAWTLTSKGWQIQSALAQQTAR
jgi:AcrR family transcriptional regulator